MKTRDEILRLGEGLMRTQGFNAFSYYHLADELKLRPAAVHYHFPTKDALAQSIGNRSRETFSVFAANAAQELDLQKRESLIRFLVEINTQIFITTTDLNLPEDMKAEDCKVIRVSEGRVE